MLAVVQEAMRDAGPRRKCGKIPGPHRVKNAVYPGFNLTLENVDELLFLLLGMRPRTSLAGRQPHQVHADPLQPRSPANAPLMSRVFVAVGILMTRLRTGRSSNNERRSFRRFCHPVHLTQPGLQCRQLSGAAPHRWRARRPAPLKTIQWCGQQCLISGAGPYQSGLTGRAAVPAIDARTNAAWIFLRCRWMQTSISHGRQAATRPRRGPSPPWLLD